MTTESNPKIKKPKPDLTGYVLPEQLEVSLLIGANDNRGPGVRSFTKPVPPMTFDIKRGQLLDMMQKNYFWAKDPMFSQDF